MKPTYTFISIILITIASAAYVLYPVRFAIETPRLGQPKIMLAGEMFELKLKSSLPFWNHQWSVSLLKDNIETPLSITTEKQTFSNHSLKLLTEKKLIPGKYSLLIRDKNIALIADAAVVIWPDYPDNISIIQLADLPTFSAAGNQQGDKQFEQIIKEINIINPDLVLFTGDLVYGGSEAQYKRFFNYLKKINPTIIAAPGNHEYQGWSSFLTYFGQPYHVNNIGPYKIISINSGHARDQLTESQLSWLRTAFSHNKNSTTVLQSHHSIMHRPKQRGHLKYHVKELTELVKEHPVMIVLSGHWHADSMWNDKNQEQRQTANFNGTPYAVTTSAGAKLRQKHSSTKDLYHGYRLIRIKKNKLVNFTYDYNGDGVRGPSQSIPMGALTQTTLKPLSTIIKNNLNESFQAAHADIVVSGKENNLLTDTGKITNIKFNNKNSIYTIEFDLPANTEIQINLHAPITERGTKL